MIDCYYDCERYHECNATQKYDVKGIEWCHDLQPKKKDSAPTIKDSGERREFETGAVRDIQEGKGRCDLLPLDVMHQIFGDLEFLTINKFKETGDCQHLIDTIDRFTMLNTQISRAEMGLNLAKHFEEGAKKYGENNWQKGIPVHCYIDSAVRHYLKYRDGWTDEPHDRAFVWNLVCCIWTMQHHPELDDYTIKKEKSNENN